MDSNTLKIRLSLKGSAKVSWQRSLKIFCPSFSSGPTLMRSLANSSPFHSSTFPLEGSCSGCWVLLSKPARNDSTLAANSPPLLFSKLSSSVLKESGPRFLSRAKSAGLTDSYFNEENFLQREKGFNGHLL